MCKLAAYTNFETKPIPANVGYKINRAIQHLWYINSYGQTDGAGIMYMENDGSYGYLKDALSSTILLQLNSFADIKNDLYEFPFLAAHTRYSTVGGNTWENSHPFEIGKYLGMQNGTIAHSCNHKTLVTGKTSPYAVDSASVLWSMDQQGVAQTFQSYEGEGVFLFLDLEACTFNIIKNKHRNLNRAKITGYNAHLYSTDAAALALVCERASLPIDGIEAVSNDTLISYDLAGNETRTPMAVKEAYAYDLKAYNNNYSMWASRTAPKPAPKPVIELPSKKYSYLDDEELYVDLYDDEKAYNPSPYVCDCDNCGSPIYRSDTFYADSSDLVSSQVVCCSSCADVTSKLVGKELVKVTKI